MTRAAELIGQGRRRIAIVGTGISGLLAARLLCSQHDVTVYEADSRIGGHTHTVDVEVGGETRAVEPLIRALIRAGQSGVRIDLIVRGACMLPAGLPGVTDNIRVRSIVGRFLEHSRVYYFENGGNPRLRIVLAGYEGEHPMPDGWRAEAWRAGGAGYVGKGAERENQKRERLWLSPHCIAPMIERPRQASLFGVLA